MAKIRLKSPGALLDDDNRWRVEEDLRTLQRAGEVTADKQRLARAKALATKQQQAVEEITRTSSKPPTKRR